jgi:hypothetical protein
MRSWAGSRRATAGDIPVDLAKRIVLGSRSLSARDAIHIAVMEHQGVDRLFSFDTGLDESPLSTGPAEAAHPRAGITLSWISCNWPAASGQLSMVRPVNALTR